MASEKIWYILAGEKEEGPFTAQELRYDPRITPDTYVWREGFSSWKKIRDIPELQMIFEDSVELKDQEPIIKKATIPLQDEVAVDLKGDPPLLFLFLLITIAICYFVSQLYR